MLRLMKTTKQVDGKGIPHVLAVLGCGWDSSFGHGAPACVGPPARIELERDAKHVVIQYGLALEYYAIDKRGLETFKGYL